MSTSTLDLRSSKRARITPQTEQAYRVCRRCIMDTTDPEIEFDEDGTCNHCKHFSERVATELFEEPERRVRLERMVEKIQRDGKGKEYDCIIGISGGVDSTMVALHVKRLGLRPLALHLDNGWNSEIAVDNIKRTLEKLDIDLYTHVIDWEEFRDLQLSFLRSSVPNCEIPSDHAINSLLVNTALRRGIRYILTGSNLQTEAILPFAWGYHYHDLKHIKAIHRRFGSIKLRTFPTLSLLGFVSAVVVRGIKYIPILNYLEYNKREAQQTIEAEFGWRDYGGKHCESIYTRFFQRHLLPTKFGYDKRRAHLSTLICAGEISRDDALKEMESNAYHEEMYQQDREFVIKKLGLSEPEFDSIMALPVRAHTDYPSHHLFYHKLDGLKQIFKRIATRV